VIVESAPDASEDYTLKHMNDVVEVMGTLEGAELMWQIMNPLGGFSGMEFVPPSERGQSVQDMYWQAFAKLGEVPGLKAFPVLGSALPTAGDFSVELVVQSTDSYQEMQVYAEQIMAKAAETGMFLFTNTNLKIDLPQSRLLFNRQYIADLGMDLQSVSEQLSTLLSGNFVNRYNQDGRAYRVIPMLEELERSNPESILDLQIRTPEGDLIPVRSIASLQTETAPRVLSSFQQKNAFKIFAGTGHGIIICLSGTGSAV